MGNFKRIGMMEYTQYDVPKKIRSAIGQIHYFLIRKSSSLQFLKMLVENPFINYVKYTSIR